MIHSPVKIRFYIYAIAFMPFMLLLGTGVIMLSYHTGAPKETVLLGQDGYFWLAFHKLCTIISTPILLLHLFVKTNWVKNFFLFKLNGKFKRSNIVLFVSFSFCLFTAIGSWLIFPNTEIATLLRGLHNKVGILLLIAFGIHLWNYRRVIIHSIKKSGQSV